MLLHRGLSCLRQPDKKIGHEDEKEGGTVLDNASPRRPFAHVFFWDWDAKK